MSAPFTGKKPAPPLPAAKPWRDKYHDEYDAEAELCLRALAVYPTLEQATEYVSMIKKKEIEPKFLTQQRNRFPEKFEKLRDELAPQIEKALANDLLDLSAYGALVSRSSLEAFDKELRAGRVSAGDLPKAARDAMQIATQATDKRLALQGRPSQVVETRDVGEILRALQGMGVAHVVDSTVVEDADEITQGE